LERLRVQVQTLSWPALVRDTALGRIKNYLAEMMREQQARWMAAARREIAESSRPAWCEAGALTYGIDGLVLEDASDD
jgi:hypothetical protein